jgi:hypothetical protein
MPQIDLKELIQKINRITTHWSAVNAAFPQKPLTISSSATVPGGLTLAQLTALSTAISADFTNVVIVDNALQEVQARRNDARKALLPLIKLFRKTVTGYLPDSVYAKQLPETPPVGANDRLFEDTGDDIASLWAAINADTTQDITRPLVLSDGTDLAAFQALLATVKATNAALPVAKETARQARATRDEKVKQATAALGRYRKVAQVFLPPNHPLLATLPTLA